MSASFFSFVVNGLFAAICLSAAWPGPHRVVCPECYGLSEVAPRIWTDRPGRGAEFRDLVATSRARVAAFFASDASTPLVVICASKRCARDFGIRGNGLSIADLIVMVAPGGANIGTLTHEMTHSRLHRSMGLRNLIDHPYPTWFDEGLATHVADHPRWNGRVSERARQRVREARHIWHWRGTMEALGVGRAYHAAAAEVARIEGVAGRSGLLELIARAEAGEDFEAVEAEVMER